MNDHVVSTGSTTRGAGSTTRGAGSTTRGRGKLDLDPATVRKARSLARQAGRPIVNLAKQHTTVSVERATLRLAGLQGADADGIPWVNRLLDAVRGDVGLEHGVALPVWDVPGDLVVQTPDARIAAWSTDPRAGVPQLPDLHPDVELPRCVLTLVHGDIAFKETGALT